MATGDSVTQAVDPILKTVDTTVVTSIADPGLLTELGFAVLVLVIIISVHGWCMGSISKFFASRFSRFTPETRQWRVSLLTGMSITLLALTHLFETFLWAAPIWWLGLISGFRDTYFFVLEAYTTLGEGTVALPDTWRLAGPMIAISGLFTFSWTGSVLVYVMTETGRRHSRTERASSATATAGSPTP